MCPTASCKQSGVRSLLRYRAGAEPRLILGVYVYCIFYLAALADSSAFLAPPYMINSYPQPLWVVLGRPYLLLPRTAEQRKRVKVGQKKKNKGKKKENTA